MGLPIAELSEGKELATETGMSSCTKGVEEMEAAIEKMEQAIHELERPQEQALVMSNGEDKPTTDLSVSKVEAPVVVIQDVAESTADLRVSKAETTVVKAQDATVPFEEDKPTDDLNISKFETKAVVTQDTTATSGKDISTADQSLSKVETVIVMTEEPKELIGEDKSATVLSVSKLEMAVVVLQDTTVLVPEEKYMQELSSSATAVVTSQTTTEVVDIEEEVVSALMDHDHVERQHAETLQDLPEVPASDVMQSDLQLVRADLYSARTDEATSLITTLEPLSALDDNVKAETNIVWREPARTEPLGTQGYATEAQTNGIVEMEVENEMQKLDGTEVPTAIVEESRPVQPNKDSAGAIDGLSERGDEKEEEEQGEEGDGNLGDLKEENEEGGEYEVEEHPTLPISERRKHKRLEIFVGGLDKDTTEEDLKSVFQKVGEVVEVRLMRNPQTGKNKGYAFIRYASTATATRAAQELERVEIRGRSCGVLPSEENDTLFLGNISKSWNKEVVLETLKNFGIENVEELTLMEDPQLEGVNRGFAFIEFSTHKEALNAFRRLQQTDAIFGSDRSAKVAWAQPLNEPDEDTMSQVKSVFVDGMPPSWDEEQVREHFGKFGAIERIVLARNMLSAKRKDFGFVNYIDRDAALSCIEAFNNTEISDGDIKMKVKVMLAKPQVKNKSAKGGTRGGYPSGFRGDHRVAGRGVMGPGAYDVIPVWGNVARLDIRGRFGGVRDRGVAIANAQRLDKKTRRGKRQSDEIEAKSQQANDEDVKLLSGNQVKGTHTDGEEIVRIRSSDGDACISELTGAEQTMPHGSDVVAKATLDKFECAMCGFGSDSLDDYELHKKTKVHKVIEGLRKDQKLHNKTPLSLLHEYASRNHCEVHYETKAETNGPFEVIAMIGGAAGGATGPPTKGFGLGRNKARAKQIAAADALEKIMEKIPESEFTKPGQSRQRFGDRDRPGRKSKGGSGGGTGSGGAVAGLRCLRERSNEDWRSIHDAFSQSFMGTGTFGGGGRGGGGRSRRHSGNGMYFASCGGGYVNPNTIPLCGFGSDFLQPNTRSGFGDGFGGRGGGGFNASLRGVRGIAAESYAERYDRIQSGRGYGGAGFGARDFLGGEGGFGCRDLVGNAFGGVDLPSLALGYGGRDMPPGGYNSGGRDYETSKIKRPFVALVDEEARFVEAQRALPRQRLEAPEQIPIQSTTGAPSFVAQPLFADAARAPNARPLEQQQYSAYSQTQSQGLLGSHIIVQNPHVSNPQSISAALAPVQGGTPYSIFDAAPQPPTILPSGVPQPPPPPTYSIQYAPASHNYPTGYGAINQDYMVNTPTSLSEMSQATPYPIQSAYSAPYGVLSPPVPQSAPGGYTIPSPAQQQPFY